MPKRGDQNWGVCPPNSSAFSQAGQKGACVMCACTLDAVSWKLFIREIWSEMVYCLHSASCLCDLGQVSVFPSLDWGENCPYLIGLIEGYVSQGLSRVESNTVPRTQLDECLLLINGYCCHDYALTSFLMSLLRYNSHPLHFTHLKCPQFVV